MQSTIGTLNNLGPNVNDSWSFYNTGGYSSIAFTLSIPTGSTVAFEGSFDNRTFNPINLRRVATDGYVQSTNIQSDNYIGSISCLAQFRVRITTSGSTSGSLIGMLSHNVSTLEGIENGPPNNFTLNISEGKIAGHSGNHKFGRNFDIDVTLEDIWAQGGLITLSPTASVWYASSTSTADTGSFVIYQTLDENWTLQDRIVALNGQNPVALSGSQIRVNRGYTSGSIAIVGNVFLYSSGSVVAGVPQVTADIRSNISSSLQQTLNSLYSVPSGSTAYLMDFSADIDGGTGTIFLNIKEFGGVKRVRNIKGLNVAYPTEVHYDIYLKIPEKSDIWFSAQTSGNNTAVGVDYDLIIVEN